MNITWNADKQHHVKRIVIDLAPGDDPEGNLSVLATSGRLNAFLRAYARPMDLGAPDSPVEAHEILSAFAAVTAVCGARLEAMQLAARDQWRMGWGTIALAVGAARSTVKGRIQATRDRYANTGHWYDAAGLHWASPEMARTAAIDARTKDDQESAPVSRSA